MEYQTQYLTLTGRHIKDLQLTGQDLLGKPWSLRNPVFLLDRCWLRLEKIRFDELAKRLPPDKSGEAPELVRYQQLLEYGTDHLLAMQQCWAEFGIQDFHRAMRNYWHCQDLGNHGWTFQTYMEIMYKYKQSFTTSNPMFPLIIRGRKSSSEHHNLSWISISKTLNLKKLSLSIM